jgi:hypothetical protein
MPNENMVTTLSFLAQTCYLLSITRFAVPYFSHTSSSGLVISGFASRFLKQQNVRILFTTWCTFSVIAWFPWVELAQEIRLIIMFTCVVFCRYFFVYLRYKSVGRGNGAPGFMVYWFSLYGFLFAFVECFGLRTEPLSALFLFDFSLIMLSAGSYKLINGYVKQSGIEYGLCNPAWCYFADLFSLFFTTASSEKLSKTLRTLLNYSSFLTEFIIGFLILFPDLRKISGILVVATFLLLLIVKLGTLTLTMITIGFAIYIQDVEITSVFDRPTLFEGIYLLYAFSLILSYLWVWCFHLKIHLPKGLHLISQSAYQFTGAIVWSVFTRNITKHLVVLLGFSRSDAKISREIRGLDEGVHSGISKATLMTRSQYGFADKSDLASRLSIYINSSLFKNVVIQEVHCYEIELFSDRKEEKLKMKFKVDSEGNLVTVK